MTEPKTICPNCEAVDGETATACTAPVCSRKGYHFIPHDSHLRNRAAARGPGGREDPVIGRLIERFLIVERLGEGGMGTVYLALQLPLQRRVALKIISGLTLDDDARGRFEREARSISMLYHPNIVSLVDYGFDAATGAPFMALEYVKGGTDLGTIMEERKSRRAPWRNDEIADIFSQVLSGLAVAHESGLVHRDMKPQNIMLVNVEGNPNFVNILDFGLVKAIEDMPGMETLTARGAVLGTPQYMAPEQVASRGEIDHRCDLYAVAAVLFEMVAGRPCFGGTSVKEIFFSKLDPEFDPLGALPKESMASPLRGFLKKALARDPSKRFADARAMKRALQEALGVEAASRDGQEAGAGLSMTLGPDDMEAAAPESAAPFPSSHAGPVSITAPDHGGGRKRMWLWAPAAALVVLAVLAVLAVVAVWKTGLFEGGGDDRPGSALDGAAARDASPAAADPAPAAEPDAPALPPPVRDPAALKPPLEKKPEAAKGPKIKGKKKTKKPPPPPEEPPEGTGKPSPEEVKAQMAKFRAMIKKCTEGDTGELIVTVTFSSSGMVSSMSFAGSLNTWETRLCLDDARFKLEVTPFKGPNFETGFTFKAGPKPASASPGGSRD